ncbi:TVP38/TMEM64 family protein [Calidifontibacillus erzurumensis]|uniref:TVP38/TMEM64 family membrane protein n=1 Tax=Calidifontibacillus erzurumensis TaxID=2741433 RepID=A0A8J8KBW4_9BACI|nr:TVP38/TMEM64 family protein [Calidifontibacillus erzurumensis]NSL52027.1 TVP38/TMEM64 family protein [Calidifontibacillus erzurumensis]
MYFETLKGLFTLENILKVLEEYAALGPLPGILLPMIEAILPVFPLILFVMANAAAFGLWKGFIISWIGATLGAFIVFFTVRKLGRQRFFNFLTKHQKVKKLMNWIERHGFGFIFILLCFPFSPSSLINLVAGLSRVSTQQFVLAVIFGKLVMIFTISFIGYDLKSLVQQPNKTIFVLILMFLLWYIGKKIERRIHTEKID